MHVPSHLSRLGPLAGLALLAAPVLHGGTAHAVADAAEEESAAGRSVEAVAEGSEGTEATNLVGPLTRDLAAEAFSVPSPALASPSTSTTPSVGLIGVSVAGLVVLGGAAGAGWDAQRRRHLARLPHKTVHLQRHRRAVHA